MGNLRDGYLTMKRLYINNLMDGYNQDCHDYFLGNLNISKNKLRSHSLLGVLVVHIIALMIWLLMSRKVKNIEFAYAASFIQCGIWFVLTLLIVLATSYLLRSNFIDFHSNHK